ncbi:MAG: histidine phosphatase family protein [Alphaproteobacteria bacterium]|nr:histidine phosphatase family protein [Alphaproteobacteria bacterium]
MLSPLPEQPFYFLRHGETEANQAGILQGQLDTPLGRAGRTQAEAAAGLLSGAAISAIYTSPLDRALETASIVSRATRVATRPLFGLLARNWGIYQGRPKGERPFGTSPRGGETQQAFLARVADSLNAIVGSSPPLIVAHSGVFRMICAHAGIDIGRGGSVPHGLPVRFEPPDRPGGLWRVRAFSA